MRPQSRLIPIFLVVSLLFPSQPVLSADSRDATEVETLGIVVASHSATLGNGVASDGATLYNGDRLVTGPNGGLSLRSGDAMLYMSGSTQVTLHRTPSRNPVIKKSLIRADVSSGSISFSLSPDQYFLVSAHGALIGPAAPMPTLGEITILDRKAFEIRARRGPLKIVYRDDSEIIPEGKSYRVELDDSTDTTIADPAPRSKRSRPTPQAAAASSCSFSSALQPSPPSAPPPATSNPSKAPTAPNPTNAAAPTDARHHVYGRSMLRLISARCSHLARDLRFLLSRYDRDAVRVNSTSPANFSRAAPESIAARANRAPSAKFSATPAATSAAAAFITTTSRRAPLSPSKIPRIVAAFSAGDPPRIASSGASSTSKSSGTTVYRVTNPRSTSAIIVSPHSEISSSPPAPCTTSARSTPSSASASATRSIASAEKTPITCDCAPAGFVSGPSKLKTVRTPICFRAGLACRVAVCAAGANKNPIFSSRIARPIVVSGKSIRTPSSSSTSADPLRDDAARFPCFATRAPAAEATIAAAVETLNASNPSPPVPHVSTICSGSVSPSANTRAANFRITVANPVSSATSTDRAFIATSSRIICGVSYAPDSSSSITASACARVKTPPRSTNSINAIVIPSASTSKL